MIVKGNDYGEYYELGFCVETCSEVWQGKPKLVLAPDQAKLSGPTILNASMSIEKSSLSSY